MKNNILAASTYQIIDDVDTQLDNLKALQRLAGRIAFGIDVDDPNKALTNTKIEELWILLDSLNILTEAIRDKLDPILKNSEAAE